MPDLPRSGKEAAVEQWRDAVDEIPDDHEYKEFFEEADIHDREDRREIEELVLHEIDAEFGLWLEDAFDDLRTEFEDWW